MKVTPNDLAKRLGMTQTALADKLKMKLNTLNQKLHGHRSWSMEDIGRLQKNLGCKCEIDPAGDLVVVIDGRRKAGV